MEEGKRKKEKGRSKSWSTEAGENSDSQGDTKGTAKSGEKEGGRRKNEEGQVPSRLTAQRPRNIVSNRSGNC